MKTIASRMGADCWFKGWWAALALTSVAGCGPAFDEASIDEPIGEIEDALTLVNEFSPNAPTVANILAPRVEIGMRVGYGSSHAQIVTYTQPLQADPTRRGFWTPDTPSSSRTTDSQPVRWWIGAGGNEFSSVYLDKADSFDKDTGAPSPGRVYPSTTLTQVGPPSGLITEFALGIGAIGMNTVIARQSNNTLRHAYLNNQQGNWSDLLLSFNSSDNVTMTTGPQGINRQKGSTPLDSIWFGCSPSSPATACEYRQGGTRHARTHKVNFGSGTTYLPGTRPVGFSDTSFFSGQRWIFAATSRTDGTRQILARQDTSLADAAPSFGSTHTIEQVTGTSVNYSSPIPYMYNNNLSGTTVLGLFYFRTVSGSGNTQLMVSRIQSPNWTPMTPEVVWNVGYEIPAGNEPVPYNNNPGNGLADQNRILFRLPNGSGSEIMKDTVELLDQSNGSGVTATNWIRTLLPAAFDTSNIYAMDGNTLYQANEADGDQRTNLGAVWSGVSQLTGDGVGLGYAIQDNKLWEINLNDGKRRQLGSETWGSSTKLAFGRIDNDPIKPRLFAIRSQQVRSVNLATGVSTQLGTTLFTSAAAITFLDNSSTEDLFIVNGNSLSGINISNGNATLRTSTTNTLQNTTGMTAANGKLFITYGSSTSSRKVSRFNHSTGAVEASTSTFNGGGPMGEVDEIPYLLRNGRLYSITGSSSLTQNPKGDAVWGSTLVGIAGRDL